MMIPIQYLVNTENTGEKYIVLENQLSLQDLHDQGEYLNYRLYDSALDNLNLILKKIDASPSDPIYIRYKLLSDVMPLVFLQYENNIYKEYNEVVQIEYTPDDYVAEQYVVNTEIEEFIQEKFAILTNILPLEFQKIVDISYNKYRLFDANLDVKIISEGTEHIMHQPTNTLVVKNAPFIPLWFEKFNPDTAPYVVDWRYATQQEIENYNALKAEKDFLNQLNIAVTKAKTKLLEVYNEFKYSSWFYITNNANQLPVKGSSTQRLQELMNNAINSEVEKELIYSLNGFVAFEILVNDVKNIYRPSITKAENAAYNVYNQFLAKINFSELDKDINTINNITDSITVNIFDIADNISDGKISIIIPEENIQAIYEARQIGTEEQIDIKQDIQKVIELLNL